MASSCVLRMCQMRSKSCNGDGLAMHGRFSDGQPSKLLISLSLLSKIGDCRQSGMSSPWNRCDALSFKQRSHRSLRNAQIRGFATPEVWFTHEKDFDVSWSLIRLFVGAYILARLSLHTCMAIFQTYGALGLPVCHIFTVSGSSLPVSIFIGRWIDHINLQAEVMESGMKMFPHMVGHEWLWWISGNFIQSV